MTARNEILRDALAETDADWLRQLMGDWQLISDLSFADLTLVVPHDQGWVCVGHVRPNTGPMVFYEDVVGRLFPDQVNPSLSRAFRSGRIVRSPSPVERYGVRVHEECVPVVHNGRPIAVITRHSPSTNRREPSLLEDTYRFLADAITAMVSTGEFPSAAAATGVRRGAPRVGDGVIHLDEDGGVEYASPNAVSALHRLGHHEVVMGNSLPMIITTLLQQSATQVDESLALVVTGRAPWRSEVVANGSTVTLRALPLTRGGVRYAALVLLRDVTELRRRERELLTKDATIREIHHRVKNNLQNVAALLRLQSRRLGDSPGHSALEEAERRVATIALVHETLSRGFDETVTFDDLAVRGIRAVVDVSAGEYGIDPVIRGSFGQVSADDATSLAMIISELVQNAADHGLPDRHGRLTVTATRSQERGEDVLTVEVTDDGQGLPSGFRPGTSGLGTQIVLALVADLRGSISWEDNVPEGTRVRLRVRLRPVAEHG
ncbi:MAG: sensor histidine kinase [Nostocoides sp.]